MKFDAKVLYSPNNIFLINNLRAIAIMAVVYVHNVGFGASFPFSDVVLTVIATIAMPLFSFSAGFYHSREIQSGKSSVSTEKVLALFLVGFIVLVPYCEIFGYLESNLSLADFFHDGSWFKSLSVFSGNSGILWFMIALFIWRVLAPVVVKIKYHMVLVFLIGMSSCVFMSDDWGWYRLAIRLVPFYFLGVNTNWEKIMRIRVSKITKYTLLLVSCVSVFICVLLKFSLDIPLTPGSYGRTTTPFFTYFIITTAFYPLSISCMFVLISFFPGMKIHLLTKIGTNCMTLYFLHMYTIALLADYAIYPLLQFFNASVLTVTLVQTAVFFFTVVVFSTDYLTRLVMNSTNFVYRNIFKN